ncbi:MAG: hypothetical protein KGL39_41025 [Patescibacteria group bacterium]|nr:hypothetical protein [Patescibacteria group bacterium]
MRNVMLVALVLGLASVAQAPAAVPGSVKIPSDAAVQIRTAELNLSRTVQQMTQMQMQYQQLQASQQAEQTALATLLRDQMAALKLSAADYRFDDVTMTFVKVEKEKEKK